MASLPCMEPAAEACCWTAPAAGRGWCGFLPCNEPEPLVNDNTTTLDTPPILSLHYCVQYCNGCITDLVERTGGSRSVPHWRTIGPPGHPWAINIR
jgi:hypothetical protein